MSFDADQVMEIAEESLAQTSAKHLTVEIALKRGSTWTILIGYDQEEWVVHVDEGSDSTVASLRRDIAAQIQRLF